MAGGQILAFPIDIDRRPYCECVISVRFSSMVDAFDVAAFNAPRPRHDDEL